MFNPTSCQQNTTESKNSADEPSASYNDIPIILQDIQNVANDTNCLSKIACVNCRELHRKCDRVVSGCQHCKLRGLQCRYEPPKKRKKRRSKKELLEAIAEAEAETAHRQKVIQEHMKRKASATVDSSSPSSNNSTGSGHSGLHHDRIPAKKRKTKGKHTSHVLLSGNGTDTATAAATVATTASTVTTNGEMAMDTGVGSSLTSSSASSASVARPTTILQQGQATLYQSALQSGQQQVESYPSNLLMQPTVISDSENLFRTTDAAQLNRLCEVFLLITRWPHTTRKKNAELIHMHISMLSGKMPSVQQINSLEHKCDLVTWYAIQATTLQRLGHRRSAQFAFDRALQLCLNVEMWLGCPHRIEIALAYTSLLYYLSGIVTHESTARMFIGCIRVFVQYQEPRLEQMPENDVKLLQWIKVCISLTEMLIRLNSDTEYSQWNLRDKMECLLHSVETTEYMEKEKILQVIRNIIEVVKDNTYPRDRIHYVLQQCDSLIEMMNAWLISSNRPIGALNLTITLNGFKIEALAEQERYIKQHIATAADISDSSNMSINGGEQGIPSFSQLATMYQTMTQLQRLAADYITKCVASRSTWFPLTGVITQRYLVLAAEVHIRYARAYLERKKQQQEQSAANNNNGMETDGYEYVVEDLLSYVRTDLWALQNYAKKFDICNKGKVLIEELTSAAESFEYLLAKQTQSLQQAYQSAASEGTIHRYGQMPAKQAQVQSTVSHAPSALQEETQTQSRTQQEQAQVPQTRSSPGLLPTMKQSFLEDNDQVGMLDASNFDNTTTTQTMNLIDSYGETTDGMDAVVQSFFQGDALDLSTNYLEFDTGAELDLQTQQRQYFEDLSIALFGDVDGGNRRMTQS